MKKFACGDVVPGCTAVFQCPSEQAILEAVAAHAHRDHGLTSIPSALVEKVRLHIQDVPVA